jgi:NCAIR mutase (PurE)-related protein
MPVDDALQALRRQPFEELGFGKIDAHRRLRTDFPEVIFAAGKSDAHLMEIFSRIYEMDGEVLATRATEAQAGMICERFPQAVYDGISKVLRIERPDKVHKGKVAVVTAGTADVPVAEEAAQTAEFFGSSVDRVYDVGVSGLHRLLARLDIIQGANCVVTVAGMEGALASVVGGLVSRPVIAVPTSVGYGASMHGLSALLTMINSCANGIAVVNIDNGYGAGYQAHLINMMGLRDSENGNGAENEKNDSCH